MKTQTSSQRINKIETTSDTISGRGGLVLFSRYLEQCGILEMLDAKFGNLRKSSKGLAIWLLFKQIFCFLFDGTSRHISYFDHLKQDAGYAATIETPPAEMASSHAMKRFFRTFGWWCGRSFRWILHRLFIWRLKQKQPKVIVLYVDTMVMDNDEADKRHGVQPTYKKKKGFQPLQILWENKIVDGIFRGGKKHGNTGKTVVNSVSNLVSLIRREYRENVTIILRNDSGFFDQENFATFDALNIGFIASGKMYEGVKHQVRAASGEFHEGKHERKEEGMEPVRKPPEGLEDGKNPCAAVSDTLWNTYENEHQTWQYLEFGFRCKSWKRFYRAIYTRPVHEEQQMLFDFVRPEHVILTNIGINKHVLEYCSEEQQAHWLDARTLIGSYHQCGKDELAHRGLKDFGFEQLPFKRFGANTAFYYCLLIAFFLFETFKEDVLCEVIPMTSYATTIRRQVIDIAAKIVKTSRTIILQVSQAVMDRLQLDVLWQKCQNPPPMLS
jgi:hypothetical protein